MANITLTSTNGLFTRLGLIGGRINSILCAQGLVALTAPAKSAGTQYANLAAQYADTTKQSYVFDTYNSSILIPSRAKSAEITSLKKLAQDTLINQVNESVTSTPFQLKGLTVQYALIELMRQMGPNLLDAKVTKATVAATTPVKETGSVGTALCLTSVIGTTMPHPVEFTTGTSQSDLQNIIAETVTVKCTADSYSGGATLYSETFTAYGQPGSVNYDQGLWDATSLFGTVVSNGSGVAVTFSACDAAKYQGSGAGGNLLNNGDFLTYTAHTPNQWTAVAGTPNTDFTESAGSGITGAQCLKLLSTAAAVTLTQQFNNAGGTTSQLQPNTVYAWNLATYKDGSATGTITVDLIDGSNATIADNNAAGNTLAWTAANTGTTYTNGTQVSRGFFRTPATLPSVYKIRIATAGISTANVFISNFSLCKATQLYTGGPYVAVFSMATGNVNGDSYSCPFTNNYGGGTNKMYFQTLFNLLFDVRLNGYPQIPVAGTGGVTTISDSGLIV